MLGIQLRWTLSPPLAFVFLKLILFADYIVFSWPSVHLILIASLLTFICIFFIPPNMSYVSEHPDPCHGYEKR